MISRILIAGLLLQAPAPPRILSVADAINNSVKYGESLVSVQGRLIASMEVTALEGQGCEVRINAVTRQPFACAAHLRFLCGGPQGDCSAELQNFLVVLQKIRSSRGASRTTALLSGKLTLPRKVYREYVPAPVIPGWPKGEYVQEGFGHMNAFPVELIVQDGRVISEEGTNGPQGANK
jgi:hypothetical protein